MQITPAGLLRAQLIRRINRFVAEVVLNDDKLNVYVPNTGRLSELAIPGTEILLSPINAKYKYKILYIINKSFPVMIDSTYSNRLFHMLLNKKKVHGLEHYDSIKSEPVYGNHRFDFLLKNKNTEKYIEIKSCTLFHNRTGAFPDAVSTRAAEHVKELAESGIGELIFFVLKNDIEKFIPNYHTDFAFYETLKLYRDKISIRALTVQYDADLKIQSLKEIPVVIPDVKPEGIFLLILFNTEDKVMNDGEVIEQGYYIYCSCAESNVFKTIAAIKKKNGTSTILHDSYFPGMKIISALPIVTSAITTGEAEKKLSDNGGIIKLYNNLNRKTLCPRLIFFKTNPAEQSWFWDIILDMRFREYT